MTSVFHPPKLGSKLISTVDEVETDSGHLPRQCRYDLLNHSKR